MILRLCGAALLTAGAAFFLRQYKPELAVPVTVAGSVAVLLAVASRLAPQLDFMDGLWQAEGFSQYMGTLIKSLGIAIIAQTAADICRDMGDTAAAAKVELAGKAEIMLLCLPLIGELLTFARQLLLE